MTDRERVAQWLWTKFHSPASESGEREAVRLIAAERDRQVKEEGWTPEHDQGHRYGDLAVVAASLAVAGTDARVEDPLQRGSDDDPWGLIAKHGRDPVRRLVIAAALIVAEIERIAEEGKTDE